MLDAKIKTFLEVAKQGGFTRAAERLHLTQPAVTQQIRRLEEHYGRKLIDTTGHAVRLTDAGRQLYDYARIQQAGERRLLERMARRKEPLKVGATLSIADYYLPTRIARALEKGCAPRVRVGNTETLVSLMLAGELDCAFVEGLFSRALFEARVWLKAAFVPVTGAEHPLQGRPCTLDMLCRYPLLVREHGSGTRAVMESALFERGMDMSCFSETVELGSFGLIKAALAATDGVSFMYEGVCTGDGALAKLAVTDFSLERPLYFLIPIAGGERERCLSLLDALR